MWICRRQREGRMGCCVLSGWHRGQPNRLGTTGFQEPPKWRWLDQGCLDRNVVVPRKKASRSSAKQFLLTIRRLWEDTASIMGHGLVCEAEILMV